MEKKGMLSNKVIGVCFFIIIISCSTVFSQTSQADGDWDDTNTWDNAMIPQLGDNVVIQHQVDIGVGTAATLDIISIAIDNNGVLNIQDAVDINAPVTVGDGSTNGTLNISTTGTVEVNAISVNSDGNFNITSSATLDIINAPIDILGDFDITGSADINTTVQIRGNADIAGAITTFIDGIDITNSAGIEASLTVTDGASLTVLNDVDVTGENQPAHTEFRVTDTGTSSTVTINGDLNYTHNNADNTNSSDGWKVKLSVNRISTLNVGGNLTYIKNSNPAGGEDWAEIDIGPTVGSTAVLDVTGNITIEYNIASTNSGTFTFESDNDAVTSANNLVLTSTAINDSNLDVTLHGNSTLTITGTTTYNFNSLIPDEDHVIEIKVSELGGAGSFTTADLIMNNNNDSDDKNLFLIGYNNAIINLGNITFTKGAGVSRDDTRIELNDNSILNLSGDITNPTDGSWDLNDDCTLVLNGTTGSQTLPDATFNDFRNVTINNTSGSPIITFDDNNNDGADIHGILTLTSGILTPANSMLEVTIESTGVINDGTAANAGNADSYIDGKVTKIGNSDFTFPIGKGGKWARLGIANLTGNATTEFTAEYFNTSYSDIMNLDADLENVSKEEYWDLSLSGTSAADITLYWEDQSGSGIDDQDDLRIAHYTGGQWEDLGQDAISFADPGNITITGVASFSPFTFGSLSNTNNPLPVTLIDFSAKLINDNVELYWSTASEINNDYFIIERSSDGINFESLEQVDGAGNSTRTIHYTFTDYLPLSPIAYYRLKQFDFDGKSTYSNIVSVERLIASRNEISLYPNPIRKTDTNFSIVLPENLIASDVQSISLVNVNGKEIEVIRLESTMNKINIEIPNHLHYSPGLYLIKIVTLHKNYTSKLIVE